MNILSILVGLSTIPFLIIGTIPLLGWSLWIVLLFLLLGAGLGALSDRTSGRNFNLILMVFAGFRLFLGGGIF
ncbi:hypothetical protein [Sphingomonas baiyangensis]|uniref:Uncharacterized protein n=1 Tax=Sphingomonas baiyangensis TaxID=2572576 RepID=A0A4V5PTT9_9SPHN|nr:hypothetical protein [Sphingomonas baiyangensis]TKD51288.1 hypothetical protein FBR43_11375 [Sphingomonas baiyangensis]